MADHKSEFNFIGLGETFIYGQDKGMIEGMREP